MNWVDGAMKDALDVDVGAEYEREWECAYRLRRRGRNHGVRYVGRHVEVAELHP